MEAKWHGDLHYYVDCRWKRRKYVQNWKGVVIRRSMKGLTRKITEITEMSETSMMPGLTNSFCGHNFYKASIDLSLIGMKESQTHVLQEFQNTFMRSMFAARQKGTPRE